jgi:hypothetical protein
MPACPIPKSICETTNLGTFDKSPCLQYKPITMHRIKSSWKESELQWHRTSVSLDSSHALWHIYGNYKRKNASAFAASWRSASLFNPGNNPAAFRFSASICDMLDQQWIKYTNSNYFQTIILTLSAFWKSGAHKFSRHAADTSIF